MQFDIPVNSIKALLLAMPKTDTRWYLIGACVDVREHDAAIVATNGHVLLALPLDVSGPRVVGQYIIPRDVLENLKPAYKNAPATVQINAAASKVTMSTGGSNTTSDLVDGQYPDWRKVVPADASGEIAQFNADYIAAFGKAHKLLGGSYSPAVYHNGERAARIALAGDAIGVIMPMRGDLQPLETPDWARNTPAASQAAA